MIGQFSESFKDAMYFYDNCGGWMIERNCRLVWVTIGIQGIAVIAGRKR